MGTYGEGVLKRRVGQLDGDLEDVWYSISLYSRARGYSRHDVLSAWPLTCSSSVFSTEASPLAVDWTAVGSTGSGAG